MTRKKPTSIRYDERNGHRVVSGEYPMFDWRKRVVIHRTAWCTRCGCGHGAKPPYDYFSMNPCRVGLP